MAPATMHGLRALGLAALVTFAVLTVPAPAAQSARSRGPTINLGDRTPLRRGAHGHDVRVLQSYLTRAGFRARVDGVFGAATTHAVRRFERAQRRPVDGRISRGDLRALRDVVANGGAVSANPSGGAVANLADAFAVGPGAQATIAADGLAIAPIAAPEPVRQVIAAANLIATLPYRYGGGHGGWEDSAYDCSGSVSYALHGAALLAAPMASGAFAGWGEAGPGRWVTVLSNAGHMYLEVAGLRYDTRGRSARGTRWTAQAVSPAGYAVRHPAGL